MQYGGDYSAGGATGVTGTSDDPVTASRRDGASDLRCAAARHNGGARHADARLA